MVLIVGREVIGCGYKESGIIKIKVGKENCGVVIKSKDRMENIGSATKGGWYKRKVAQRKHLIMSINYMALFDERKNLMDLQSKVDFKEGDEFGYLCDDGVLIECEVIRPH
eukprot:56000_1